MARDTAHDLKEELHSFPASRHQTSSKSLIALLGPRPPTWSGSTLYREKQYCAEPGLSEQGTVSNVG